MSPGDLAAAVGVDPKTVDRWLAGRVPHRQHREAASDALRADEEMLWPDRVRTHVKTGHDREIVSVYPCRSAVPRSLWRELVTGADRQLVFAGYTSYFLWMEVDNFRGALRRKADQGVSVRFIVGDPASAVTRDRERIENVPLTVSTRIQVTLDELGKLAGSGIQIRFSDRHIALSVFVFDNDMLICTHLADQLGHDSPTYHIRKRRGDGIYDRYFHHVEHLWETGRPPATS